MAEYYVIKNKETGMYFRGKGVNRWGKHFNQASIYRIKGTAEHSVKDIALHGDIAEIVPIQIVETDKDDIVSVVRCKDCTYHDDAYVCNGFLICPASNMEITDNDYCSYGERKEADGNG